MGAREIAMLNTPAGPGPREAISLPDESLRERVLSTRETNCVTCWKALV
jgi:hypothetical protein